MRTVYFDSNIYAALESPGNQSIKSAINSSRARGQFSLVLGCFNIEESLGSRNLATVKRLLRLFLETCDPSRLLKPTPEIIAGEVVHILEGVESNPFYMLGDARQWFARIQEWIDTSCLNSIPNDIRDKGTLAKRDFLEHSKQVLCKFRNEWQPFEGKGIAFDEFWRSSLRNDAMMALLKGIAEGCIGRALKSNESEILMNSLDEIPSVKTYLLCASLMIFNYHVQGLAPRWGDNADMHHITTASYSDIFVTEDKHAIDFLRPAGSLLIPRTLSLKDFAQMLGL